MGKNNNHWIGWLLAPLLGPIGILITWITKDNSKFNEAMKYPEEDIANDLYSELNQRFQSSNSIISIKGAGVHWQCTIKRENSKCRICCFSGGTEYYTEFIRDAIEVATSRIPSKEQTIDAVFDWLDRFELEEMYKKYSFVDFQKRELSRILDEVMAFAPELRHTAICRLDQKICDIYQVNINANNRSCEMSFFGKNDLPKAMFTWDECQLFSYQPDDNSKLAAVLKRWICDSAPPSSMRNEFKWLHIGDLADYYEVGKPIEGEFIKSWDGMESFYDEINFSLKVKVKKFMRAMRAKGYDKTLRAGQSLSSLIVSRSRRHGMRQDQPSVQFWFHVNGMEVYTLTDLSSEKTKISYTRIELNPEIESFLLELQTKPID